MTKKQPTSHIKRENEMTTTGNAAAPAIPIRMHQQIGAFVRSSRPAFKNFARWVEKDEDIEYDLLVPKQEN